MRRVAMLVTGDEIINGDILDTNSAYFAQQLRDHGIPLGQRVSVSDNQSEIESAIRYLLHTHEALITIAGLGPTSDDRTRFALANVVERPLEFNDNAWQWIVDMLTSKGLAIPETNRQQALFPSGSQPIHNPQGTAAACYLKQDRHDIFMLPGPPNECRPIFHAAVLPRFLEAGYAHKEYQKSWLLLGVSEGSIAEQLEKWMTGSHCILGFRVHYPYLEVKLRSTDRLALQKLSKKFLAVFKNKLISETNTTASEQLLHHLIHSNKHLSITDNATFGLLEATLSAPETRNTLHFRHKTPKFPTPPIEIKITGLEDYWGENKDRTIQMPLSIHITTPTNIHAIERNVHNRGEQSLKNAVEIICWELLKYL